MNLKLLVTIAGILMCSTPAFAEKTNPFYLGLGAGGVEYSREGESHSDNPEYLPRPETEKSDTAFHISGGYSLTDWLAVELDYADYGEIPLPECGVSPDNDYIVPMPTTTEQVSAEGISLSALAKYPLHRKLDAFLRFGLSHVAVSTTVTTKQLFSIVPIPTPEDYTPVQYSYKKTYKNTSDEILLGVGSNLKVSKHVSARLEWTYINNANDYDLSAFTLGMIWNF